MRGGAIYIDCENKNINLTTFEAQNINAKKMTILTKCEVILQKNNVFKNNYAQIRGGAIAYKRVGFIDADKSTVFDSSNKVGFHSQYLASYASKIKIDFINGGEITSIT